MKHGRFMGCLAWSWGHIGVHVLAQHGEVLSRAELSGLSHQ